MVGNVHYKSTLYSAYNCNDGWSGKENYASLHLCFRLSFLISLLRQQVDFFLACLKMAEKSYIFRKKSQIIIEGIRCLLSSS